MMSLLRNRSLMLIGAAEMITNIGGWITSMALYSILIFQEGGGMGTSSALFLASLGPALLLSPVAGYLCDRFDRRKLMIASRLLQGLATVGLIFTENLILLVVLLILGATFGLVMGPARTTAVPDLVAPEELTQANAFMQQVTGTVKILAPALAGGLLTLMAPHTAIILDVICFMLSAVVLLLLPPLPPKGVLRAKGEAAPKRQGMLMESFTALWQSAPGLVLLFPLNVLIAFMLMAFDVAMAVYVRDILQTGIAFKGLMGFATGAGLIVGSSAFLFLKGERNLWRDVILGFTLVIALSAALALGEAAGPVLARAILLGGGLLGGLGMGVVNVQAGTLFMRQCPPAILGRVGGLLDSIVVVGRLGGLLLTPLLVPAMVSFGGYFGLASILLVAAVALTALALRRLGSRGRAEIGEVAMDGA